jgi:Flp pilus assembly protein CpaB
MTWRSRTTTFVVGLVVAVAGTFGIYRVLEAPKAQTRIATRLVVVALHDIPEGRPVERTAVTVARWPLRNRTSRFILGRRFQSCGRVVRVSVFKGEVIMPGRLADASVQPEPHSTAAVDQLLKKQLTARPLASYMLLEIQ